MQKITKGYPLCFWFTTHTHGMGVIPPNFIEFGICKCRWDVNIEGMEEEKMCIQEEIYGFINGRKLPSLRGKNELSFFSQKQGPKS